MTGFPIYNPGAIYGVRMSNYGSLCPNCQKPFRTPRAKMCAECGYTLPEGTLAGPLLERDD
jgi:predicted amidophosphoribosyltransferase